MATDATLRTIITVLDKTSGPLRQINARFFAMSSPVREISSRIGELAEQTGISRIGEQAKNALGHIRGMGAGLLQLGGALTGLGAAASVAGMFEIVKSTAEFAEQLAIGSAKTGIATEQLAGWHYAAGLVNVDAALLDRGFTMLNRNIAEAAGGKAKEVQQILGHMGLQNTVGHLVGTADALRAVSAEVKHLADSGQVQVADEIMEKLFGRAGRDLEPLFAQGPEGISKALAVAKESGISLTASQAAAGAGFMESIKGMSASVEGLKVAIGNDLYPVLKPVIDGFRDWLDEHRVKIAREIGDAVQYLSDKLHGVNWDNVKADLKEIWHAAKGIVHAVGGIGPAAAIVGTISFAPTIMEFGRLGVAIGAAAWKMALFPVGALLFDFVRLTPAIRGTTTAMVALNLAMDANPIGAVVVVATALAVAGYEIYKHWEDVMHLFERIKNTLGTASRDIAPSGVSGYFDPNIGSFVPTGDAASLVNRPPLSAMPGAAAAVTGASGAAGASGRTDVTLNFKDVPRGTAISTESRGNATPPDVNVGWAFPP